MNRRPKMKTRRCDEVVDESGGLKDKNNSSYEMVVILFNNDTVVGRVTKEKNRGIAVDFLWCNYNTPYTIAYSVTYPFSRERHRDRSYRKC